MRAAPDDDRRREEMVRRQVEARGVRSPSVLRAMKEVRRERYVPSDLAEFAFEDTPLPIEEEQTISQPYVVALMIEALELEGGERVLEVGTGSGYAAAVLSRVAGEVYTIERHASLVKSAEERLARDGYANVHVRHGDGTRGWPEAAPFDAIVVAAGGGDVPASLKEQLAIGGRLVIPVGEAVGLQKLVRVTRVSKDRYEREELADVRFVPLIGEEKKRVASRAAPAKRSPVSASIAKEAEAFADVESADLGPLLDRIGDARVVLLGEATHGTSEFYRMRARITQELVREKGFTIVAAEADWPDAARVDHYVRGLAASEPQGKAFARFPTWMWRNREFRELVDWMHDHNERLDPERRVRFAGLDLYALHGSIAAILAHLDEVDPSTARLARERYACLTPWQRDPASYGRAVLTERFEGCEDDVVEVLEELLAENVERARAGDERWFETVQNARLVADAERYYRIMYYGSHESWNLRDRHMTATLEQLLDFHGPSARAIVWAHNSHLGDARATDMAARGELNVGQLCRERWGDASYAIGFGTHAGSVIAASSWDGPRETKRVRPSHERSYERACHDTSVPAFFLPLRAPRTPGLREELAEPRLERAIGVIYRPETELASHYFHAVLPYQFDEYVWFDETHALTPLRTHELEGAAATYPFGL